MYFFRWTAWLLQPSDMQQTLERREINVLDLVIWRTVVKVQILLSFWNTSNLLLNTKMTIWKAFYV